MFDTIADFIAVVLISILHTYHGINSVLGTLPGELLKVAVEFLLLTFVTYMTVSEYGRTRSKQLGYLISGFAVLAVQKLISVFVLSNTLFGDMDIRVIGTYLPVVDNCLEILALVLITHAFVYPLFSHDPPTFRRNIRIGLALSALVFIVFEVAWLIYFSHVPIKSVDARMFFLALEVIKVAILIYPFYKLARHHSFDKYNVNVCIAFAVYMLTPIARIIDMGFYTWENIYLYVFSHPFPILAIVLFTRVVYLKLVDKANLQQKLIETEQKYLQEKEVGRLKDEFVSVVSHELRTPLTSMKLYLSILVDGKLGKVEERQKEALTTIIGEANRLSELINDILALSKLESKKVRLRIKECDLRGVADHTTYLSLSDRKNQTVVNQIPDGFIVDIDADKFRQVFINLFTNAVKYTPDGGTIWIGAEDLGGSWRFFVKDTGVGIKEEHKEKIWERFYQVGDYMTRTERGTGLGLAIVKNIVEMHGGKVDVESEFGKGSTFFAVMPKKPALS